MSARQMKFRQLKNRVLYCIAGGKTVDATQEMLALGACNLISSFVGSMPISGALSRGAVNNASGVKTTFGGVYTGNVFVYVTPHVCRLSDDWRPADPTLPIRLDVEGMYSYYGAIGALGFFFTPKFAFWNSYNM